jgi:hypothetical protein
MSEPIVQIGAILDSISTRKDKSIKVVFETNEVSAQEAQILFSMRDGDSETFYREHMEKVLNWIKDKLEPEA